MIVTAVLDPRSIGVRTFTERLSVALLELGVDYRLAPRPVRGQPCHFHLANSTRRVVPHAAARRQRFLLTVHDVVPRTAALRPLHRAVVVPLCVKRAARLVVHSRHAAQLLAGTAGIAASRIEVVPLPAPAPRSTDRAAARVALGLELDGPPLFVLPGTFKPAKLVHELLTAAGPLLAADRARLLVSGHIADERLAAAATAAGARLLRDPDPARYEQAIVAADAVLCVRADTVGETNGPLVEAIGAHRPSLVTNVGSAPEVAGASACIVEPTASGLRAGIEALLDDGERAGRADAARRRAAELTWEAAARYHAELLAELNCG